MFLTAFGRPIFLATNKQFFLELSPRQLRQLCDVTCKNGVDNAHKVKIYYVDFVCTQITITFSLFSLEFCL